MNHSFGNPGSMRTRLRNLNQDPSPGRPEQVGAGPQRILASVSLYRMAAAGSPGDPGDLVAPVLVGAFDGWVDAGTAATTALAPLVEGAPSIATFDSDQLFDYRSRRPTLEIVDGRLSDLAWPSLAIRRATVGERDLLVLVGPEPDDRWQAFADAVVEIARQTGAVEWI